MFRISKRGNIHFYYNNKIIFSKLDNILREYAKYKENQERKELLLKTYNKVFMIINRDFYEIDIYNKQIVEIIMKSDYEKLVLTKIEELCKKDILKLSCGFSHYIALTRDNKIYCWGNNSLGQLGNSDIEDYFELVIESINFWRHNITFSLNKNIFYFDKYESKGNKNKEPKGLLENEIIVDVKCGFGHSLAKTKDGKLYAWGYNVNGQIGNGSGNVFQKEPILINGFKDQIIKISCGFHHSMALTKDGNVYSWGNNSWGQLGNGNTHNSNVPNLIEFRDSYNNKIEIKDISCGRRHSLLLTTAGDIYAFGDNEFGQLGNKNNVQQLLPEKLIHLKKFDKIKTNFDKNISVALSKDIIYFWGECAGVLNFIRIPMETIFQINPNNPNNPNNLNKLDEIFSYYSKIIFENHVKLNDFIDPYIRNEYYNTVYDKNYRRNLGQGSYGVVYETRKILENNKLCAIKIITPNNEIEREFFKEFVNYSFVKNLNSNHFVKHFDAWFEINNNIPDKTITFYIEMELCDKTLMYIIEEISKDLYFKKDNSLTQIGYYVASQLFIEILEGVQFLHEHNIIHRDLNPYNILLKKDVNKKFIKIGDFGIVAVHTSSEQTHGLYKGKQGYIAPEVRELETGNYDTFADIYSLGRIFMQFFCIEHNQ
jgi:alpha-tubulin suppressor-like RCC1 family protein